MRAAFLFASLVSLSTACLAADLGQQVDQFYRDTQKGPAFSNLKELCTRYPGRLAGTESLRGATAWAQAKLEAIPGARVSVQETTVPGWRRGARAEALVEGQAPFTVLALGSSAGTPKDGLMTEVVEVKSLAEVEQLGRSAIEGKIVFFNRPMDLEETRKGSGYGKAVDQRGRGPRTAASLGAAAALVRSITIVQDDVPHAGITSFDSRADAIPAAALGIQSADRLSAALKANPRLKLKLVLDAESLPDLVEKNIVAEIRGREFPDQIIVVGGHLDTWDNTAGVHDNGAGVVGSIEAFRLLAAAPGPRHTLRCVLFTCEEIGAFGGREYARRAAAAGEKHRFAIESDTGGFPITALQFGTQARGSVEAFFLKTWAPLLKKHGIERLSDGYGGTDVGPLQKQGAITAYLCSDFLRYFAVHHAATDTLDKADPAEIAQGAATLAAALYLADNGELP